MAIFEPREFTEYEENFIAENCDNMTVGALRDALGIPWPTIKNYLERNGLKAKENPKKGWAADLHELEMYAGRGYSYKKIARLMGRTELSVYQALYRYGIKRKNNTNKHWSDTEDKDLRELWVDSTLRVMCNRLGRTKISVLQRGYELGLPPLTNIDSDGNLSVVEFCNICGITRDRLDGWVKKGFPLRIKKLAKAKRYRIDIDTALQWMEYNQNEFDASLIEEFALTREPEWLRWKRKVDTGFETDSAVRWDGTIKVPWSTLQHRRLVEMCAERAAVGEMAVVLNRTDAAIEARIRGHKIPYVHPKFYSDEEKSFIEANYKTKSYAWMTKELNRDSAAGLAAFCVSQGWARGNNEYTDEEKAFIEANYKTKSYEWIAQSLGRSKNGVKALCQKSGWLKGGKRYSEAELSFIQENYLTMSDAELAANLPGRTKDGVQSVRRKRLGLTRQSEA